jgi:hypothetical protein
MAKRSQAPAAVQLCLEASKKWHRFTEVKSTASKDSHKYSEAISAEVLQYLSLIMNRTLSWRYWISWSCPAPIEL